ncbi:hypothetical protein [Chelativorans salis]|uniref:Uncharacterized protein n=1 Tax=Chelativorans salis TaxID=2978478 RepID=A0ABT2LVQ3_9HYPH|nr:hypothetical protein [Chelativorans sp. EGI FJ00035]MCT7378594.1 hypothetical protein [Chelativorans sp. EGI FJ00035]
MEKIRNTAIVCIGRAVMFGALAIVLIMVSLSFDLELALFAGAALTLAMAEILIIKAQIAPRQNPKRTEVWTCLDKAARPAGAEGKAVFTAVLRDVYVFFARNSYAIACSFFAASLFVRIARGAV